MNLSELLKKDIIRKIEPEKSKASELIEKAEKDIKTAQNNLKNEDYDWALAIAYNAMLSAGMALMFGKGYRSAVDAHHVAVVQFCGAVLPSDSSNLVAIFNKYRIRRHDVVYGEPDSVSKSEAERAISNAKEFVERIKKRL